MNFKETISFKREVQTSLNFLIKDDLSNSGGLSILGEPPSY